MANEAILRNRLADAIDFTVSDSAGIEKGTLCKLTDPRTASASAGLGDIMAGIAAREKIITDGRTQLAMIRQGIFDLKCSGGVTVGSAVISSGELNTIKTAVGTAFSGAAIIGTALEAGDDAETIQVHVNIGGAK